MYSHPKSDAKPADQQIDELIAAKESKVELKFSFTAEQLKRLLHGTIIRSLNLSRYYFSAEILAVLSDFYKANPVLEELYLNETNIKLPDVMMLLQSLQGNPFTTLSLKNNLFLSEEIKTLLNSVCSNNLKLDYLDLSYTANELTVQTVAASMRQFSLFADIEIIRNPTIENNAQQCFDMKVKKIKPNNANSYNRLFPAPIQQQPTSEAEKALSQLAYTSKPTYFQ